MKISDLERDGHPESVTLSEAGVEGGALMTVTLQGFRWCARWAGTILICANAVVKPPPLVGQTDTAKFVLSWTVPPSDTQHPPAAFYHVEVVLGDTTAKSATPTSGATGLTTNYANAIVTGLTWSFPLGLTDTLRIVRPLVDSTGPYRFAVQSGVGTYPIAFVLGPWVVSAAWWVKPKAISAGQPYPPLGLAIN